MHRFARTARAALAAAVLLSLSTFAAARADDEEREATCAFDAISGSHAALLELARDADGDEEHVELVRSAFATLAQCESQVEPAHKYDLELLELGDLQNLQNTAVRLAMAKEYRVYSAMYAIKVAQVQRDPATPVTVLKLVSAFDIPAFHTAATASALTPDTH